MEPLRPSDTARTDARQLGRWPWRLTLLLVTLCAIAIRWYYLSHAMVYQPIRGDAIQYHAYAWNLVHHGIFSKAAPGSASVISDSFRDPGYPLLLAFWMKLFGDGAAWYMAVLLSQGLLGALTVPLLMSAARGWLSDRWLIGAGVIMALWPHSVTITSFLLSETLFGFLCALALCLLSGALRRPGHAWLAAAGLGFAAATLTNAILLPFAPLLGLLLLAYRRLSPRMAASLVIASLVLPLAWNLRNAQLPAGQSSSGRALINLVQGSWPEFESSYARAIMGEPRAREVMAAVQQEVDVTLAQPSKGLSIMAHRMAAAPLHYLVWYLSKPALLWDWSIRIGQGDIYVYPTVNSPFNQVAWMRALESICYGLNPLLMLLAFLGCVIGFRRKATGAGVAIAALFAYVTVVYGVFQSEPRYSIPFRGAEILLAVSAVATVAAWYSARRNAAKRSPQDANHGGATRADQRR